MKQISDLYSSLKNKQLFLLKFKENVTSLEEFKRLSINEILISYSSSKTANNPSDIIDFSKDFYSLENWEEFLQYSYKNEQHITPNIEEYYMKTLNEILYKIEMSTIVYENILGEIDNYELLIKINENGNKTNIEEEELRKRKEIITVMEENFMGDLKELTGKM